MTATAQTSQKPIPAAQPPAMSSAGVTALVILMWLMSFTVYRLAGDESAGISEIGAVTAAKALVRVAALGALVVLVAASSAIATRRRVLRRLVPFGVFAVWCTLSSVWSADLTFSIGQAIFLFGLLALSAAVGLASVNSEQFIRVLKHLTAICLFVSLVNLAAAYAAPGLRVGDRPAAFMHPNMAAQIAGLGVMLLVIVRLIWNTRWSRVWLIPGLFVAIFVLIMMHSRTAILATAFCTAASLFLFGPRRTVVTGFVFAAVLCAVYLVADPDLSGVSKTFSGVRSFILRGQTTTQFTQATGRTEMWRIGYEAWRKSPVIGHGNWMMTETGEFLVWGQYQYQTAHNLVLHVLTGTGVIGLFLMLAGWSVPVLLAWRSSISRSPRRHVGAMVIVFYAWFLMVGMYELSSVGTVSPVTVVFFALTGVACGRLRPHEEFVRTARPVLAPKEESVQAPA